MSESYWWCSNCKEEVDGRRVTFSEKHMDCGHYVECITPEKQERIAVLEDEMRFLNKARDSYLSQALNHGITIIKLKEDIAALTVHPALCDEYPKVCANNRIAELETALREIQDHCAGKTGSLQAVVVVIVRKALEGR
jgi:hypothetical protein